MQIRVCEFASMSWKTVRDLLVLCLCKFHGAKIQNIFNLC
jgi:hypothetical protein